ncbi:uncharacterized protein LOC130674780 [Microplitis mediator]|uniref:uncharacterized protein LOC130674780 n=1 Tax=Microplitis mediator TaxID=375433 RepID=UPI002556B95E|nr:uncharacterized protein LOC130674780 [Microplitis mediator]
MPKRVKSFEEYSRSYQYKILRMIREEECENSRNREDQSDAETSTREDSENSETTGNESCAWSSSSDSEWAEPSDAEFQEIENRDSTIPDLFSDSYNAEDILELLNGRISPSLEENHSNSEDDDWISISSHETLFSCYSSQASDSGRSISSEESLSSEESDSNDNISEKPLYPGAPLSFHESSLAILLFTLRHKVSDALLSDLLSLISAHCIEPNHCLKTKYKFKKYFDRLRINYDRHFFCPQCHFSLPSEYGRCPNCEHVTTKDSSAPYFITMSILAQLSAMFSRSGFYDLLKYRFTRTKLNIRNKEDIYDGNVYSSFMNINQLLSKCANISFTWNTDGVSPFKSSKFNIWPFFLRINELPFLERIKPENTIFAGLWFGYEKPDANKFMSAFYNELKILYEGFHFNVPGLNLPLLVQGFIMCGTLDLPAKAQFLNMSPHMARYGCQKCKVESEKVNHVQSYRYKIPLKNRTTEETIKYAKSAINSNKPVKGVKGPTFLSKICYDFIRTTAVDSMHCVDLGVCNKLFSLLFDKQFATHRASMYRYVDEINSRIRSIRPPCNVLRLPRSISDIKYWKAHEFRAFLLYYSLPLLHDLMDKTYFDHLKFFVSAVSLLHQESISDQMITLASRLLSEFVGRFEDLYGLNHMTCNLHHLLHLPNVVRDLGPLWVTSCYPFEGLNGLLKKLIHGTRYVQLQISSAVTIFINITQEKFKTFFPGSQIVSFCERLELSGKNRRKLKKISANTVDSR